MLSVNKKFQTYVRPVSVDDDIFVILGISLSDMKYKSLLSEII